MNKKLLAGLATIGLMAGGGSATVAAVAGAPATASTAAVASSTPKAHECGPLGPLVAKGTITNAQAIAIHDAFIGYVRDHWRSMVATVLDQQVKNHTITKAQASAITAAITQWAQKYQSGGSGSHGPCHYGHGQGMMGSSGNR